MVAAPQSPTGELHSFMNESRWRNLRAAIEAELSFIPASQVQRLNEPPVRLAGTSDCYEGPSWDHENIQPYRLIEWMRLIPRRYEFAGALLPSRLVADCTKELRDVLIRQRAPFYEDQQSTFWIYGYAPSDPATFSEPWYRSIALGET